MQDKKYTFEELQAIIRTLRKRCPWDSVQTHASLKNCLVEEAYEVLEALDSGDGAKMADEMGDLLMQILLHAEIGEEAGEYTFSDVCDALAHKMVRRHPAIFSPGSEAESWDEIKKKEKNLASETEILENISKYLPALQRSMKFSQKMRKWGKEEENISRYLEKIEENLQNIEKTQDATDVQIGAILYAVSGICGLSNRSPELILNNFLENFAKTLEK